MPTYREYYCYDDLNAMHGIEISKEECPWIDDEVPAEIIEKDQKDATEYNRKIHQAEADARAERESNWVCTDTSSPWFGQGHDSYGFKESMYAIDPNRNRGMGW